MNEDTLKRTLNSVGMKCFVNYYDLFGSEHSTRESILERLESENDFTEGSCRSRTGHALRIFRENANVRALEIIRESNNVDFDTQCQATRLHLNETVDPIDEDSYPLIQKLKQFKAPDENCKEVYCTTCGGLSQTIETHITPELKSEINEFINGLNEDELFRLEDWVHFFRQL